MREVLGRVKAFRRSGFVALPRSQAESRWPCRLWLGGAFGFAFYLALIGYFVALMGFIRANSLGLAPLLPTFWLASVVVLALPGSAGRSSPARFHVVRSMTLVALAAFAGQATRAMLSWPLFPLGHHGDNPSVSWGAMFGFLALPIVPLLAFAAGAVFGRRRALSSRVLSILAPLSVLFLLFLVGRACIRHRDAPDVAGWLNEAPLGLRGYSRARAPVHIPPPSRQPGLWEPSHPGTQAQQKHIHRLLGLVIEHESPRDEYEFSRNFCKVCVHFEDQQPSEGMTILNGCDEDIVFGHDPRAQLLFRPRFSEPKAFDYGLRRVVRGVQEIRRPLAPPPEWTLGGAAAALFSLLLLARVGALPARLKPGAFRQGYRAEKSPTITFSDDTPPCSAAALPSSCSGPVLVSMRETPAGGYRDAPFSSGHTFFEGTFDEVVQALQDTRDEAFAGALAITWIATAPLVASWWAGLL